MRARAHGSMNKKSQKSTPGKMRVVMITLMMSKHQHQDTCWQLESDANQVSPKWRPTRMACTGAVIIIIIIGDTANNVVP